MSWVKSSAYILILTGISVLLIGNLMHVGIILLIEGGVLFTLVEKKHKQDSRSPDRLV